MSKQSLSAPRKLMPTRPAKDKMLSADEIGFVPIWEAVEPYTMTSFERGVALYRAVRHIVREKVPGAFVECGVWRGGSAAIVLAALAAEGATDRDVWLYDTFSGMTEPSEADVDVHGRAADVLMESDSDDIDGSLVWARAELDVVKDCLARFDYPQDRLHYVVGDVRETLPTTQVGDIALLRLDTDFYDSTRVELETLYPRLVRHGVLIIDGYGHWRGCRAAVDEYFSQANRRAPLLNAIDYTGRIAVKSEDAVPL